MNFLETGAMVHLRLRAQNREVQRRFQQISLHLLTRNYKIILEIFHNIKVVEALVHNILANMVVIGDPEAQQLGEVGGVRLDVGDVGGIKNFVIHVKAIVEEHLHFLHAHDHIVQLPLILPVFHEQAIGLIVVWVLVYADFISFAIRRK